jgi:DNA-binding response OmpR family regulator
MVPSWGSPGGNVVDVCVGCLRKLEKDLIETVRGMGYRMVDHS